MGVDSRYDKYGEIVHKMSGLVPSVIAERDVSIKDVVEMYRDDLPSPMHTEEEIIRWKRHWVGNDKRPDTVYVIPICILMCTDMAYYKHTASHYAF